MRVRGSDDPGMVDGSRVPLMGVVYRPVSPRADTGPTVSRFSAHTETEVVSVGTASAAAVFTPWDCGRRPTVARLVAGRSSRNLRGRRGFEAMPRRSAG